MKTQLLNRLTNLEKSTVCLDDLCPLEKKMFGHGWTLEELQEYSDALNKVDEDRDTRANWSLRETIHFNVRSSIQYIKSPQLKVKILAGSHCGN